MLNKLLCWMWGCVPYTIKDAVYDYPWNRNSLNDIGKCKHCGARDE